MCKLLKEIENRMSGKDYSDLCFMFAGERVTFPYRQKPLIATNIKRYLKNGYSPNQISEHLNCSVQYVYKVRNKEL